MTTENMVQVPAQALWVLMDNPTGNPMEATHLACGPDPVALVQWLDPETPPGAWSVTRCINGDLYESPCGRYCITSGPVYVPALAQQQAPAAVVGVEAAGHLLMLADMIEAENRWGPSEEMPDDMTPDEFAQGLRAAAWLRDLKPEKLRAIAAALPAQPQPGQAAEGVE